jgi:hypothetical protein
VVGAGLSVRPGLAAGACGAFAMLRFHLPLIEPDMRSCRIRLSEKSQAFAHGRLCSSRALPSLWPVVPSAASERCWEFLDSSSISRSSLLVAPDFNQGPFPSPGLAACRVGRSRPSPRYYGPIRHPRRPGLVLTDLRLRHTPRRRGFPVLRGRRTHRRTRPISAFLVSCACMLSPLPRQDRGRCWLDRVTRHGRPRRRPSTHLERVGSCVARFGACTAFT